MFFNKSILALLAIVLHISAVTSMAIKVLPGTRGGPSSANEDATLRPETTTLATYLNELAAKYSKSEAAKTAKDKQYAADIQYAAAQSVIIGLSIGAPASSSSTTSAQGNVEAKAIINRASWNAAKGAAAKTKLVWNVVKLAMKSAMGKHKKGLHALAQVADTAPPPDAPQSAGSSGGTGTGVGVGAGAGVVAKHADVGAVKPAGGSGSQTPQTGGKQQGPALPPLDTSKKAPSQEGTPNSSSAGGLTTSSQGSGLPFPESPTLGWPTRRSLEAERVKTLLARRSRSMQRRSYFVRR